MSEERPIEVGDSVYVINAHCRNNPELGKVGKVTGFEFPYNNRILCVFCRTSYPSVSKVVRVSLGMGEHDLLWQPNWLKRIPGNDELGITQMEVDDLYMPKLPVTKAPEETRAEKVKAFLRELHALNTKLKDL